MASTLTVTERFTIHAEGARSGRHILWGAQAAPVSLATSKRDAQFANIYDEPIWVKALFGDLYVTSTAAGTFNPTAYRMLMELRPSRGYAWTPGPRAMWYYSDFLPDYARLDLSFLPQGGLVLQPKEGFLLTFANDTGQGGTMMVGMEAYMPRDPAKTDWHDESALWSPIFQQGIIASLGSGAMGYLPVRGTTVNYQDSLSNETDRPIVVRSLLIRNVPTDWGSNKGLQMTIKIRRKGGLLYPISEREILGGISNYVSPGQATVTVEEQRLVTLKKPYLMEPNETLRITYGICTDYYGASGYADVPAGA